MTMPMQFAANTLGLKNPKTPTPSTKPSARRGRKPSTKLGASHLGMLQKAHAAGDFGAARTHALNYAKATMGGMGAGMGGGMGGGTPGDTDADDPSMSPAPTPPAARPTANLSANPSANPRAMLAKIAMSRRK